MQEKNKIVAQLAHHAISERIRMCRECLSISQKEMAKNLNLKQRAYSNYENGNRKIPRSIIAIVSTFGIDFQWLLEGYQIPARIGHRFAKLREEYGLQPDDFAKKLNKPLSFITAIENYIIMPSRDFLGMSANAFGQTLDFYEPQNKFNKSQRALTDINEKYRDILGDLWPDEEFKSDLDSLISRWRRIKSLESRNQK
jgi:transcriptional regulator with XRE-family HTH domain